VAQVDGEEITLRFVSQPPVLELASKWQAHSGPGPVHHCTSLTNCSNELVTIGEQATFDVDLAGASTLWCIHSDGITPDRVGVYEYELCSAGTGERFVVRTHPTGGYIPYVVLDASQEHGVYFGMEWSHCRTDVVVLANGTSPKVRLHAGNLADVRAPLEPGDTLQLRPGFVGAYQGDLDDAGNRLRRWLMNHRVPEVLRRDASYPKVQWNAFGATGKTPGSWDPVERKFYPLIDDIAPLGFEEVMIDVGWWHGEEPDSDPVDWPSGMRKAADYAHRKGLRFGLYWTDSLDMADPAARKRRANRIRRLFEEYDADSWRSDCTRGEVIGASFAATRGFYEMVDQLARDVSGFQWENCSGGGRIKDYGAMHRAVKIFNSDTYSALHVRQAFYDSSFALHPIQLEGHLGSTDGRYRPRGPAGVRYAFRSSSMGAPEWFLDAPNGGNGTEPWTDAEKQATRECVRTYKSHIRPLVRNADLYHVLPRPDGQRRDAIQYFDPEAGKGVVFLFQPTDHPEPVMIPLRGLDPARTYLLTFQDGTHSPAIRTGAELIDPGLRVDLRGDEVSELVFLEGN
jgi:hypothetical protein